MGYALGQLTHWRCSSQESLSTEGQVVPYFSNPLCHLQLNPIGSHREEDIEGLPPGGVGVAWEGDH